MKIQVGVEAGSYSFNAAGKAVTIAIPGSTVTQDQVLAILHAPTGAVLFMAGLASYAPASFTAALGSSVLTLNAGISTAGMNNSDTLTILVNNVAPIATKVDDGTVMNSILKVLTAIANPMAADPSTGRLRVTLDNIASGLTLSTLTTVSTVTTVTTVASVTNFGTTPASTIPTDIMHMQWADAIRGRIS